MATNRDPRSYSRTGIAGLSSALKFAAMSGHLGLQSRPCRGSTRYAQGGIAQFGPNRIVLRNTTSTLIAELGFVILILWICAFARTCSSARTDRLWVEFTKVSPFRSALIIPLILRKSSISTRRGSWKTRILHADDSRGGPLKCSPQTSCPPSKYELLENHIAVDLITEGKILKRGESRENVGGLCSRYRSGRVMTYLRHHFIGNGRCRESLSLHL